MAKNKTSYVCTECGADFSRWLGQCPECKAWNTISEFRQPKAAVVEAEAFLALLAV